MTAWWLLLALWVSPAAVLAAYPPIYDVEVIVFLNRNTDSGGEYWLTPDTSGVEAYNGSFPEGEFTELAHDLYGLTPIQYSLEQSRGYRVLFHRAWRQLAYDREHGVPYPVRTLSDPGNDNVEGFVKLLRERFLHLDIDLFLRPDPAMSEDQRVYHLQETRRVRSGEVHYFDHPKFGVIARVTPYAAAQSAGDVAAENTAAPVGAQDEQNPSQEGVSINPDPGSAPAAAPAP